ncbi:hypothetical protein IEQ34_014709 [Dendrobium chrysotoxum]|uniref:DUF4283 domain-containing protein n=1 Tax=Dendrobium chrysotoxum TaxID=161865 RepID=A0AAV7GLE4_DENCH|nr:hypothetical protein IEQ34_014709 [Dendrobium chrysotoxum]
MKLMKWSSEFDIAEESPSILIWVSFPNTHPYLFARHILHGLSSIFGANTCMVDSSMAMENGTSSDPKEIGLVLSHEKLDVVNMVLCDVNTVILNDFSSDLDVYSGDLDVNYG